jgi:hypothetical protein
MVKGITAGLLPDRRFSGRVAKGICRDRSGQMRCALILKIVPLVAVLLLASVDAALACLASHETIHNRELALIYTGLKKVALRPDDLAEVKKLEAQAERLHKGGKFEQAQKARHEALVKIGYRYEPATPSAGAPPPQGQGASRGGGATGPSKQAASKGCGGDGGRWVAPVS